MLMLHNVVRRGSFGSPKFQLGERFTPYNRSAVGTLHRLMYRVYDTHLGWENYRPQVETWGYQIGRVYRHFFKNTVFLFSENYPVHSIFKLKLKLKLKLVLVLVLPLTAYQHLTTIN